MTANDGPVFYFDGICNLCNSAVQYVIKHDKKRQFRFASLQSESGEVIKRAYQQLHDVVPDSLLLSHQGRIYSRSDAALQAAILLDNWKWVARVALAIPKFIRDAVYDLVARNRYRWFGKKEECMVPTAELRSRFLS